MISILIPTMGTREKELKRLIQSLENQTYKDFEVVIVSQGNHDMVEACFNNVTFSYKHIKSSTKGASVARNIGLKEIKGNIFALSDDDCWYVEDSLEFVYNYFTENNGDILCCQYYDPEKEKYPKEYPKKPLKDFSKMQILKKAAIEIFVNADNVKDYTIGFDERFGVGTGYNSGEENMYLMDLKKLGYKLDYYPKVVAYHNVREKDYLDEKSFIAKGPVFKRLFGTYMGIVMYTAFTAKKIRQIDNCSKLYFKGIEEYFKCKL